MPFVLQSPSVILHKNPQQLQTPKLSFTWNLSWVESKVVAGMSGTTWVQVMCWRCCPGKSQPCCPPCSPVLLCWCSLFLWSSVCKHSPEGLETNPSEFNCCCSVKTGRVGSTPRRQSLCRTIWLPKACVGKHFVVLANWFLVRGLRWPSFRASGGVPLGNLMFCGIYHAKVEVSVPFGSVVKTTCFPLAASGDHWKCLPKNVSS